MIFIHAFDPGQVTGHCWLLISAESKTCQFSTSNLTSLLEVWQELLATPLDVSRVIVQCESFHLYPHRAAAKIGSSFPEIEVIGVVRLYAQLNGYELYERPAAMVKNSKVAVQLQKKGSTLHENDALKHGLLCVRTILKLNTDRWIFTRV